MEVEIKGNPGLGNRFSQTQIDKAEHVYPSVNTINQYVNVPGNRIRHAVIAEIIVRLSELPEPEHDETVDIRLYEIRSKIKFNRLGRWAQVIRSYALWSADMDRIYREFDRQGRSKSDRVMNWLNRNYLELRDEYKGDILFDQLKELVYDIVNNDPWCDDSIDMEMLDENVCIVLVDAFMKCRIFEKPLQDYVDTTESVAR